jgi:hypothetical protein
MKKFLIGAALTVFAMTGANAAVITTTWTGTVTRGSDALNYFGGGSMVGKAFTAIYVFDDALGTTIIGSGNDHSLRSAAVSASLTINGLTFSYSAPSFYSELYADQDSSFSTTSSIAKTSADTYLSNSIYDIFSATYADESFANYSGNVANALGNTGVFSWASGPNNRLTLKNTTYSISTTGVAPAVPEPATWAMMIGGFGGIGGAMRARRRKVSVTFA